MRSTNHGRGGTRHARGPQGAPEFPHALLVGASQAAPPPPPWSLPADAFDRACTRCAKCIDACPTHVLKLAAGIVQVDYAEAECTFCGACVDICPEPAFDVAARASGGKPWHAVARIDASCLARLGVECDSCGDACEAGAIRFRVHAGPVPDPRVDSTRCTGCGACVRVCPATAIEVRAPTA